MAKLTKRTVDAALAKPTGAERFVWDDELRGFGLRIKVSGAATYVVQYRTAGARQRRMALGRVGVLTPDEARGLARQALAAVAAGRDPAAERREARQKRAAVTFAEVADRWVAEHANTRLKPRSLARAKGLLE